MHTLCTESQALCTESQAAASANGIYAVQVSIPLWALVHLPVVVTVTTAIFTPKGWLHCILYVLFENAMGIVKMGAVVAGKPAPHTALT